MLNYLFESLLLFLPVVLFFFGSLCLQWRLSLKHLAFILDAVVLVNPVRNIRKAGLSKKKEGKVPLVTCLHLHVLA